MCVAPRRIEWCGILQAHLLLGGHGRAFDDGTEVKNGLEQLRDPAEGGITPVVEAEREQGRPRLSDESVHESAVKSGPLPSFSRHD